MVDLADVTLAFEDANSKLPDDVSIVSVADVDTEECVADSLVGILMMRFGKGVELFYFGHDIEAEVWSRF